MGRDDDFSDEDDKDHHRQQQTQTDERGGFDKGGYSFHGGAAVIAARSTQADKASRRLQRWQPREHEDEAVKDDNGFHDGW